MNRSFMRILHLIHTPRHSGAEKLVADLCHRHNSAGHKIAVASLEPTDPRFQTTVSELMSNGIEIHTPARRLTKAGRIAHFRSSIREAEADIVFAHSVLPSLYGRLSLPVFAKSPKFVTVLHSASNDDFADPYLRLLERFLRRRANYVVAVSDQGAKSYRNRFGNSPPMQTIMNGIDLDRFSVVDRREARTKLELSDGVTMLLQVGRLSPVKAQASSIQLLSSLIRDGWNAELWLAGLTEDPQYENELKRMAADDLLIHKVRFLGSRTDIPQLLAAADLYLMPSEAEAHSIAFLEALASGVPVLASDIAAFQFAVGIPGVSLVDTRDPKRLSMAKALLTVPAGVTREVGQFDIRKTAESYLQLAEEICRN